MASISIKTSKIITKSGKVPLPLSHLIKDDNQNGLPDFIENSIKNASTDSSLDIEINGKKYTNWDQVPPEDRLQFKDIIPPKTLTQPEVTSSNSGQPLVNISFRRLFLLLLVLAVVLSLAVRYF